MNIVISVDKVLLFIKEFNCFIIDMSKGRLLKYFEIINS